MSLKQGQESFLYRETKEGPSWECRFGGGSQMTAYLLILKYFNEKKIGN